MSRKKTIFNDKKINKSNFCKNKKLFQVDKIDFDKILVSKKNHLVQKIHLNISLYIIIMMSLDNYV